MEARITVSAPRQRSASYVEDELLSSLHLDRRSAERRPYEEQLHDWIRESVESGKWPAGQQLPSVSKIMEHTGVGRTTVNLAMKASMQEGLIEGRRGLGRFVAQRPPVVRVATARLSNFLAGLGAYEGEIRDQGRVPHIEVTRIEVQAAGEHEAVFLELEPGTPVLLRERIYYADGRPVQLATSYLPDAIVAPDSRIRQEDTGPGGIYARLVEENGLWYSGWDEMLRPSRPPLRRERRLLSMSTGAQIWPVDRVAREEGGMPVELCRSLYVASPEMAFVYRVPMRQVMDYFQHRHGWVPPLSE